MKSTLFMLCSFIHVAAAQRFLREGFSSQMEGDFRGEMKLEDQEAMAGMSREMFLMQDVEWELQPPSLDDESLDDSLKRHIQTYLNSPIALKLNKRKGKHGLRAVGRTADGKKLRAYWRQAPPGSIRLRNEDFLDASYDDAVQSRLFTVEFEVQLPPVKKGSSILPSIVYQVPVEPGSMNPKAIIPRGFGQVKVYPAGHEKSQVVDAGSCKVGMPMKAGLVDPSWAKGRPIFRQGRSVGFI